MKNVSLSSPATQVWRDSSVQWTIQVNIVEEFAQQWKMSDFGSPAIQVWSNLSGQWRNINKNLSEHCWGTWLTMKVIDCSSPATGVEELKWIKKKIKNPIMLKDLIPLLRYLINNKTVWLGIHSSEQRKYEIRRIFSWNKYWRNYMIAQWSSCVLKIQCVQILQNMLAQRLGFWERNIFSHSDRSLDIHGRRKQKHFRCTFERVLKPVYRNFDVV